MSDSEKLDLILEKLEKLDSIVERLDKLETGVAEMMQIEDDVRVTIRSVAEDILTCQEINVKPFTA